MSGHGQINRKGFSEKKIDGFWNIQKKLLTEESKMFIIFHFNVRKIAPSKIFLEIKSKIDTYFTSCGRKKKKLMQSSWRIFEN